MEEEGTVVYFEDSPGACVVHSSAKEELVVNVPDEFQEQTVSWSWGLCLKKCLRSACKQMWSNIRNHLLFIDEEWHVNKMVRELKESSLLTDEDIQLLNSALSNSSTQSHHHPSPTTADSLYLDRTTVDHTHSKSGVMISHIKWFYLLPLLLSMGYLFHPLIPLVGVVLPYLAYHLVQRWVGRILTRTQMWRLQYYSAVDKLLTQLTTTIHWLQEIEVVSRGITHLLPSLPYSRLDQCHTHKALRKHVLWTCADVLHPLRATTRQLCDASIVKLVPELQESNSYLAFHPLGELHQFMAEDTGSSGVESTGETLESISLESIKDACTLLAVQNSELLRRLCLIAASLSMPGIKSGGFSGSSETHMSWFSFLVRGESPLLVVRLSHHLQTLEPLLRDKTKELAWSLNFHKNMLLEIPPATPPPQYQRNDDLWPLAEAVHCMDLKTQCLLHKVRGLGECLTSPDGTLITHTSLEGQFSVIQSSLRGVVDSLDQSLAILSAREGTKENSMKVTDSVSSCNEESVESADEEERKEGSEESEEEVFEGYVHDDLKSVQDKWERLSQEELQCEEREVPVSMLRELRGVLTIRNQEREMRKQLRLAAKAKQKAWESENSSSLQQTPALITEMSKAAAPDNLSSDLTITVSQPTDSSHPSDMAQTLIPSLAVVKGEEQGEEQLSLSAEIAAAIRQRKSNTTEQVFS